MEIVKDRISYVVDNSRARMSVKRDSVSGLQVVYDCVSESFLEALWRLMDYSNACLGAHRDGVPVGGIGVVRNIGSVGSFELRPWEIERPENHLHLVLHERNALERVVMMYNQIVYPILRVSPAKS